MSAEDRAHRFVIGTTDPDWFAFLKAHPELQEINFWRPGGAVSKEPSGTPWFFRVRGTSAIYGCGFVSTSYQLPVVTAWDTFGTANGYGAPTLVTPRIGQKSFRVNVTRAYARQCAITNEKTLPALEAAHIRQFAQAPSHATSNGILLRSDIHHLFDQGYVRIRPDLVFRVSKTIRDEFSNGRDYYALDGLAIREPERKDQRPDRNALDWHYSTLFRG